MMNEKLTFAGKWHQAQNDLTGMFPFKTDEMTFTSGLTDQEIQACLEKYIKKQRLFQNPIDGQLYGVIKDGYAKFEVVQSLSRNTPIAIITWYRNGSVTEINSYVRLDDRVTFIFFPVLLFGIYPSYMSKSLFPLIFILSFFSFFFFGIVQSNYNLRKIRTLEELDIILNKLGKRERRKY